MTDDGWGAYIEVHLCYTPRLTATDATYILEILPLLTRQHILLLYTKQEIDWKHVLEKLWVQTCMYWHSILNFKSSAKTELCAGNIKIRLLPCK
jgi:hypothetical protein